MTDTSGRDAEMDRLLRRTSAHAPEMPPTPACLDAETAAAWLAGEWPAESRDATLAHLADCARCQQLLATITRLETDDEAAAEEIVTSRLWWTYLVPIGAIAIMLALVVGLPHETPTPQATAPAQPAAAPSTPAQTQALRDVESRLEPAPKPEDLKKEKDARLAANERNAALDRERATPENKVGPRPQPAAPAPSTAQAAAANAPAISAPAGAAGALRSYQMPADAKLLSQTVVVSPDRDVQWRLRGDVVEKSTDSGASWTATPIGSPASWTAGSAPSSSVCWLVGRAGAVARTVDGRTWQRVAFPAQTDLSAIQATDAQAATVTTADGRTFVTTDGGNTWIPRVVQEVRAAPFRE